MAEGDYRWLLHRTEPQRDAFGTVVRWFGSCVDIEDLQRTEQALHRLKAQLHRENIALREKVSQASMSEEIVGSSAPLHRMRLLAAKVANVDSTVLFTGQTGTGLENTMPIDRLRHLKENRGWIVPRGVAGALFAVLAIAWPGVTLAALIIAWGSHALADGMLALVAA